MRLPDEAIERLLDGWPVARLATIGPDGLAHQVPIVFARAGGRLWSPVDGKPKAGGELVRVANARRFPRVSLLLDHYDVDWRRLWWLRVEATAEVVELPEPEGEGEVRAAIGALRRKYPQYGRVPLLRDPPTLLALRPESLHSWCASPEAIALLIRSGASASLLD